ncbi:MAG: hypothetical protein QXQ39_05825 [Conexivisphaerales archaeon]
MANVGATARDVAFVFKMLAAAVGFILAAFSFIYLFSEISYIVAPTAFTPKELIQILSSVAGVISGITLVSLLPESLRTKIWRPRRKRRANPVYGYGTVLAVGVGATLGSPLFVIIPENIIQYELVSVGSLLLAGTITFLLAKLYADMYVISRETGNTAIGSPSFTKLACGTRSVRYFLARVTKWIANTTLAAYCAIIFVVFATTVMPNILSQLSLDKESINLIVYTIIVVFAIWFVLNTVLESRFLKTIGFAQILLTTSMVIIITFQGFEFGTIGSWNLTGLISHSFTGNWPIALLINTAYIYLLFFGFEEIQSLDLDSIEESNIPFASLFGKKKIVNKTKYFRQTMMLSVIIALCVNIFYALAIYALHPSLASIESSGIPALFISLHYLGPSQALLTAVAFLIATFTTFVPAFLAASRHLASLGEDGYMPKSVSSLAWIFTTIFIALLVISGENFLVNITDFMVLVGLGITALSAIWLRKDRTSFLIKSDILPLITAIVCIVIASLEYVISESVTILGIFSIIIVYLMYDVVELGAVGVQLFLAIFDIFSLLLLSTLPAQSAAIVPIIPFNRQYANEVLLYGLGASTLFLIMNIIIDVYVIKRTFAPTIARAATRE